MITLALYCGPKRVAEWPLSPFQDMDTASRPRVVLESGDVVRIVRLSGQAVRYSPLYVIREYDADMASMDDVLVAVCEPST